MNLKDLKKEIPFKWKIQSFSYDKTKCSCVAYIDARAVMDLLDDVCGPENWTNNYKDVMGVMHGGIGILCGDTWVWKWDAGTESNMDKEKGQSSDAFKRAGVQWGIGRFLYRKEIIWLGYNEQKKHAIKPDGAILWSKEELSDYIHSIYGKQQPKQSQPKPVKEIPTPPKMDAETTDKRNDIIDYFMAISEQVGAETLSKLNSRLKVLNNGAIKKAAELTPDQVHAIYDSFVSENDAAFLDFCQAKG